MCLNKIQSTYGILPGIVNAVNNDNDWDRWRSGAISYSLIHVVLKGDESYFFCKKNHNGTISLDGGVNDFVKGLKNQYNGVELLAYCVVPDEINLVLKYTTSSDSQKREALQKNVKKQLQGIMNFQYQWLQCEYIPTIEMLGGLLCYMLMAGKRYLRWAQ